MPDFENHCSRMPGLRAGMDAAFLPDLTGGGTTIWKENGSHQVTGQTGGPAEMGRRCPPPEPACCPRLGAFCRPESLKPPQETETPLEAPSCPSECGCAEMKQLPLFLVTGCYHSPAAEPEPSQNRRRQEGDLLPTLRTCGPRGRGGPGGSPWGGLAWGGLAPLPGCLWSPRQTWRVC